MNAYSKISWFLSELQRRKVYRTAVAYAVGGFGVIEGAGLLQPTFGFSQAVYDFIVLLVTLGFPVALILAWLVDITPSGIQRTPDLTPEQLSARVREWGTPGRWVLPSLSLVVVLSAGYFAFFRSKTEVAPPGDYVAVFPFEDLTGRPEMALQGRYLAHGITEILSQTRVVRLVSSRKVQEVLAGREEGSRPGAVAEDLGVGIMVTGSYAAFGDSISCQAQISRVVGGEILNVVSASGRSDDPRGAVKELAERVAGVLAITLGEFGEIPTSPGFASYSAFQAYVRGLDNMRALDYADAAGDFEEAFQLDSTFYSAVVELGWTFSARQDWGRLDSLLAFVNPRLSNMSPTNRLRFEQLSAYSRGDWEGALEPFRGLYRLDPASHAYDFGNLLLMVGRPEEALQVLSQIDMSRPFWRHFAFAWNRLSQASHLTGRYRDALQYARQGKELFPEDLHFRALEIEALIPLGKLDEVFSLFDEVETMASSRGYSLPNPYGPGSVFTSQAQQLDLFGYHEESRAVARRAYEWYQREDPGGFRLEKAGALIQAGDFEEALPPLRSLLAEEPDNLEAHGRLGIALARTGDPEHAAAEERWLRELDRPHLLGRNTFWRAAILAHLNRKAEAVRLLNQALREGQYLLWGMSYNPYLTPLWGFEPFELLSAHKG